MINITLLKIIFMNHCAKVKHVKWLVKNLYNVKNCLCNMIISVNILG